MTITIGSLFSGIGGLDLGLERAGMKTLWQVELDPYARAVLARHWPHATRFEDVREIGAHNAPPVDLICGGFPCQDISLAGKGAGLEGERSGLWVEFARIVRELRPRYVVVENTPALLGRGIDRVLGDLAACGYDAEWDCIPAAAIGAPHQRDRLFIVAHCDSVPLRAKQERKRRGQAQTVAPEYGEERPAASIDRQGKLQPERSQRIFGRRTRDSDWWASEPDVARVVHGVPSRMDRERCLGNAVVPQVAEFIGRAIMQREAA